MLYDVFIYNNPAPPSSKPSYIVEYTPAPADTPDLPPLLSYLKRHVLRSKVKVRDVSEQYDIWASWGSEIDQSWETPRVWNWGRSGAVEPVWTLENEVDGWPWGTEPGVIRDRRGVGLGRRLLVPKGDKRECISLSSFHALLMPSFQPRKPLLMTLPSPKTPSFTGYYTESLKGMSISHLFRHFPWTLISISWEEVRGTNI